MRLDIPKHQNLLQVLVIAMLGTYLAACTSAPAKREDVRQPEEVASPALTFEPVELPPSAYSDVFSDVENQLLGFHWMNASQILEAIPQEQMNSTDRQYVRYLKARIFYIAGDQDSAEHLLHLNENLDQSGHLALDIKSTNLMRHMLRLSGNTLRSALTGERIAQRIGSDRPVQPSLMRSIWHDLQRTSAQELRQALNDTTDTRWSGWLSLSLLNATARSETELHAGLQNWLTEYSDHPLASALPGGLDYLLEPGIQMRKVALMLPLSGRLAPAAKAVRDGYLSSYYAARSPGAQDQTRLEIMDLNRYANVADAYDAASARGAELIIGPLGKNGVASLGNHPARSVPVLALNRADSSLPHADMALVQLALAPEDEAIQISRLAFGTGARNALIIRPAGNWGVKMERALRDSWEGLGGAISSVASYSGRDEYSSSISSALELDQSERRSNEIRALLGGKLEFTARRRQDIDAVFLLSRSSSEARSIKPLLAYHYAGKLPIYATSSIYSGTNDSRDKDLNGVRLVETPWSLGDTSGHPYSSLPSPQGDRNANLRALGADAFLLQSRFKQLQSGPELMIRGNTGLLSLDPQLRIVRELRAATFDRGVLRAQ